MVAAAAMDTAAEGAEAAAEAVDKELGEEAATGMGAGEATEAQAVAVAMEGRTWCTHCRMRY